MSFADNLRQQAQDEILKEEQKEQAKLDAIKEAEDIKKRFLPQGMKLYFQEKLSLLFMKTLSKS